MKSLVKVWKFLWNHFLTKLWFWLVVLVAIVLTICGAFGVPIIGTVFGPIGQIILGIVISPFVIIPVWLIVLTVDGGRLNRIPWGNIFVFVLLFATVAAGFWYFRYYVPAHPEEKAGGNQTQTQQTNNTPAQGGSVVQQVYQTQRAWTPQTLEIPDEGLSVYLYQGWRGFTQGGAIIITTPEGKVFHDKPGVPTYMGIQPEGIYVFRPDPQGSKRSIVLYNRW
jgi:hypothetical protein